MADRLHDYRWRDEVVPEALACTERELREALGCRSDASFAWMLGLLEPILLRGTDRAQGWVTVGQPGRRKRERRYVFREIESVHHLHVIGKRLRFDARERGDRPPGSGDGGRVVLSGWSSGGVVARAHSNE